MQPVMFNQYAAPSGGNSATAAPFPDLNFYSAGAPGVGGTAQMGGGNDGFSGDFGGGAFGGSSNVDLSGSMGSGSSSSNGGGGDGSPFDDEAPLLEELGINFRDIWSKTLAVSIPFRPMPTLAEDDADLAGPLVFCLLLGTCLLLTGKVHFGYIYGFGLIGCLIMYVILNLMSDEAISVDRTMSILGYSLLPIVLLAIFNIFINLKAAVGMALALLVILWCTLNATRLFEKALSMQEQRYLVAYPVSQQANERKANTLTRHTPLRREYEHEHERCALQRASHSHVCLSPLLCRAVPQVTMLYACFALLTIF